MSRVPRIVAVQRYRVARHASGWLSPARGHWPVASTPRADPNARAGPKTGPRCADRPSRRRPIWRAPRPRATRQQPRHGFVGGDANAAPDGRPPAVRRPTHQARSPALDPRPSRAGSGDGGGDAGNAVAPNTTTARTVVSGSNTAATTAAHTAIQKSQRAPTATRRRVRAGGEPVVAATTERPAARATTAAQQPYAPSCRYPASQQAAQIGRIVSHPAVGVPHGDRPDPLVGLAQHGDLAEPTPAGRSRATCSSTWTAAAS